MGEEVSFWGGVFGAFGSRWRGWAAAWTYPATPKGNRVDVLGELLQRHVVREVHGPRFHAKQHFREGRNPAAGPAAGSDVNVGDANRRWCLVQFTGKGTCAAVPHPLLEVALLLFGESSA